LLERCLRGLFPGEVHYCDYYRHCRRSPCVDPRTNLQKCHDFDLRLARAPGWIYLVQYRHPLEAITSWYEAELRHRHKYRPGETRLRKGLKLALLEDSEFYWQFFLAKYVRFWRRFVAKWAMAPPEGALLLSYRDFVQRPVESLAGIVEVVAEGPPASRDVIEAVVREQKIGERRSILEFRYYDARRFGRIEGNLERQLTALHLPRLIEASGTTQRAEAARSRRDRRDGDDG
jgi:hypothetical protein